MATIEIGVNNCFAIGRYPEPEEWLRVVKDDLGLSIVQYSFDLSDPVILDDEVFSDACRRTKTLADEKGVYIQTGTTGEVVHKFNCLLDPNPGFRASYLRWYEKMIRGGSLLGVEGCGVYMGTMSRKDEADPTRKSFLTEVILDEIAYLSSVSKEEGQSYFLWEPMSVPREIPCTIDETAELLGRVNERAHVPVRLNLDVGHGYIRSGDPRDSDPYAWIRELGRLAPAIHIQQTDGRGSRHWPFSEEYNKIGIIEPERVFEAIEFSGAEKTTILFEFFYSAHAEPDESALDCLKTSVEYWAEAVQRVYG